MKLSTKLFAGFAIISFIFMAVQFINYSLSKDVLENSNWVAQSQIIIRNSSALQRNIIDMETGFRGYLLTGDEEYLIPYVQAKDQIPSLFQSITTFVSRQPEQLDHIEKIHAFHSEWVDNFAEPLISQKRAATINVPNPAISTLKGSVMLKNAVGKTLIDSTRVRFKKFNSLEYKVREARRELLDKSISYTRNVSTFLTIFSVILGLLWAWYITRLISGRINTMVRLADKISKGEYKTQISDTQNDELSKLSASLNIMAVTIDRNITELERKNKELDQYAYVISHDLKAPLRGIENASRWIEEDMDQSLPARIQEYLVMMRVRVHRMENLINGILDLARIGRTKKMEELINVHQLLLEILETLNIPSNYKIEMPDEMPQIYSVRIYLEQVFSNLISNAVKYNSKEEALIRIRCTESTQFYTFSITDNGQGIDPEYHDRIFVIFQTLQERDALESTGVGLAIVKKIVERQGGTIWVESQPGIGSTFTFTWPKMPPSETNSYIPSI